MRQVRLIHAAIVFSVLATSLLPRLACADAAEELWDLFSEYDEWTYRVFPEEALAKGDDRYADKVTDHSIEAIKSRHDARVGFLQQLERINRSQLDPDDQLNHDLFASMLRTEIDRHAHRTFLMPVGGWFGFETQVPAMATSLRLRTLKDHQNYVARLKQVPTMTADVIERMRIGIEEGRTRPRVTMAGIPARIAVLLMPHGLSMLRTPLETMPSHIAEERKIELLGTFDREVLPAITAALRELHDFCVREYIPACRQSIAATEYPDGVAFYNQQIREMTTLDLTAREVHEIGLREVARIRAEMMDVIRSSDFMERDSSSAENDDALFAAFIDHLRNDERFYHTTPADLLNGYKVICKDVDAQMPAFFNTLPRLSYGVREIPRFMAPTMTTAYYDPGNLVTGKAGFFFANTYRLDQRPKYEMIALTLHEAVPGHHHQGALAQELENVPEFRKDLWFTAYGEGWALYAEKLGIEMGLYHTPYDHFGRLLYEMWRACRLVVDTGIHAFHWTREHAIAYMRDHTALSELNIANEVDRYIGWPGQALAYKLGEITISGLREEAETKLGAAFDVRVFHDVLLLGGSVPLTILEERVRAWIENIAAERTN